MEEILLAIVTLGGLGFLFALGLLLVARKFCVPTDPRLEKIFSKLPGANCGACGMPGCMGFAEALLKAKCSIESCVVSDEETKREVARILGVELTSKLKTVAVLHCNGGRKVKERFVYQGIKDCEAAALLHGGPKACRWGCLGFGSCARACPFGAIIMGENGLPVVREEKCTSCGICVKICPKGLFSLVPVDKNYTVRCKSKDLPKKTREICVVGCIACRRCERICPTQAIKVIENLAYIDYNKCRNYGKCLEVCPTKCISLRRF